MDKLIKKIIIIFTAAILCGLLITFLSAFIPAWTLSSADMENLSYGFPLKFIEQRSNVILSEDYFPFYIAPDYKNNDTTFNYSLGGVNFIINFLSSAVIISVIAFIPHKSKQKKEKDKITII